MNPPNSLPSSPPRIAIVGGCGHIGLPLGVAFANHGARVTLIDTSAERAAAVLRGEMPFLECGGEAELAQALASGRLSATTVLDGVRRHDAVIVTIGTPVDEFLNPDVQSFDRTMAAVLDRMEPGQLLLLRSTLFPGVTERLGREAARRGLNIEIAYCPERIAQGYAFEELKALPQIVSGVTERAVERAEELFGLFSVKTIRLTTVEAELAKLFTNAFRYINFAISNQFYSIAEKFGADFEQVRRAVTEDYPRMSGFAKAGFAGGPCLLKDTMQLAAFNHGSFVLGQAAMMVNEGLPAVLVERARAEYDLPNMTAAILGMAFKGNNDDPRDSLSYKLRKLLSLHCRRVLCTDVYIRDPAFVVLDEAIEQADIVFVGACHEEYRDLVIRKPLVDIFGFLRSVTHEGHGNGCGGVHRGLPGGGTAEPGARGGGAGQLLEVRSAPAGQPG